MIDPELLLRMVIGLSAAGRVVSSIECIRLARFFRNDGPFSSEVSRLQRPMRGLLRPMDFLFAWPGIFLLLMAIALLAAACAVSAVRGPVPLALLAGYISASALFALRSDFLLDGADKVTMIAGTAACLASIHPTSRSASIALFFLAGQLTVIYTAAGAGKLARPGWRSGESLMKVFSTDLFGRRSLYRWLAEHRQWLPWISKAIVVSEILWGLAPWSPPPVAVVLLAFAGMFHVIAAVVMGLNTFVLAFPALYPAAIYVSETLYRR